MPYYFGYHLAAVATAVSAAALHLILLALVVSGAPLPPLPASAGDDVVFYSYSAFDGRTSGLVVATSSSILSPAAFLFDAKLFPELNRSEGFLLLSRRLHLWAAGAEDSAPIREASFNTSFTVDGNSLTVSFVVLLDSFPPLAASPAASSNRSSSAVATNSFAAVEVGTVYSYGPESPDVGLNVTVTPNNGNSSSSTVWIEYSAAAHRLQVRVAGDEAVSRPANALIDTPLDLASRCATQSAFVGFFAGAVRDAIDGVRGWRLTADRVVVAHPRSGSSGGSAENGGSVARVPWLVILVAALASVLAATAGSVTVVVCYLRCRRREVEIERMVKLASPRLTPRGEERATS